MVLNEHSPRLQLRGCPSLDSCTNNASLATCPAAKVGHGEQYLTAQSQTSAAIRFARSISDARRRSRIARSRELGRRRTGPYSGGSPANETNERDVCTRETLR